MIHQDNSKPYTSLVTRQKLLHPPYNPDLALSDYHLFRSLQNSLNGQTFTNNDVVKSHLVQFFFLPIKISSMRRELCNYQTRGKIYY